MCVFESAHLVEAYENWRRQKSAIDNISIRRTRKKGVIVTNFGPVLFHYTHEQIVTSYGSPRERESLLINTNLKLNKKKREKFRKRPSKAIESQMSTHTHWSLWFTLSYYVCDVG